jgi:predicted XRE-type DNA-binding protein
MYTYTIYKIEFIAYFSRMSPRRTKKLVRDVLAWLETTGTKQVAVAKTLNVTPQGLTNILKGRAEPTGEQALALQELIRRQPREK